MYNEKNTSKDLNTEFTSMQDLVSIFTKMDIFNLQYLIDKFGINLSPLYLSLFDPSKKRTCKELNELINGHKKSTDVYIGPNELVINFAMLLKEYGLLTIENVADYYCNTNGKITANDVKLNLTDTEIPNSKLKCTLEESPLIAFATDPQCLQYIAEEKIANFFSELENHLSEFERNKADRIPTIGEIKGLCDELNIRLKQ